MSEDPLVANLARRNWLIDGPLASVVSSYIHYLCVQRYANSTIRAYLSALAHFGYWLNEEGLRIINIDGALVDLFLRSHLPSCNCPTPRNCSISNVRTALRHLLVVLQQQGLVCAPVGISSTPVAVELEQFRHYLAATCGLAQSTCYCRVEQVRKLLIHCFGTGPVDISRMTARDIEDCITAYAKRWKPVSLAAIRTSLKSYLRFRTLLGDQTQSLIAALPLIADYSHAKLPKRLTDAQLDCLLQAFDLSDPIGLRDYAIARCLVDLGLRGHEVAHLCLESLDWPKGVLRIAQSKTRRVQHLPLPVQTGQAIAQYLRHGRPMTCNRRLFVRHLAPVDKPLGVGAIRNVIFRAFRRCGLDEHLYRSHALRHSLATRLQRSGASVKEIADVLRHQNLQSTTVYAKIDLESLRAVALPWPGRQS